MIFNLSDWVSEHPFVLYCAMIPVMMVVFYVAELYEEQKKSLVPIDADKCADIFVGNLWISVFWGASLPLWVIVSLFFKPLTKVVIRLARERS